MEKNIKIFAILALMCMAYAMPVDEQQQQEPVESVNEPQLDLLLAESSPITDSDSSVDEVVREKRHYGGGYGNFNLSQLSYLHKNCAKKTKCSQWTLKN